MVPLLHMALIRAVIQVERIKADCTQASSGGVRHAADQSVNGAEGRVAVALFFLLWAEYHLPWHVSRALPGGVGDGAYHGVPQNENGQLRVFFLHEINVLQAVPDEDVEI